MKKISISTNRFFRLDPITCNFRLLRERGYDAADCQYFVDTENDLFAFSAKEFESHLLREKERAAGEGIELYQTHGPWRWPVHESTKEELRERWQSMARSIEGNAILGAKVMVIHPIMPFGTDGDPDYDAFWQMNLDHYGRLGEIAQKYGVIIGLENMPMPNLRIAPIAETLRLIRELNNPYIRFCLDTGHGIIRGDQPDEGIRMAGDLLAALHIHDNGGVRDEHIAPGKGVIRWDAFRRALETVPDEIPVNFEYASDLTARETFELLR